MTTARRMLHAASGLVVSGGGGGFTPDDLDNQGGWWDFTDLSGFSHGDPIGTAVDRFGVANSAINTNGASQPAYATAVVNGLPAAEWTDGADWLDVTLTVPTLPCTFWAAANLAEVPTGAGDDNFLWSFSGTRLALFADAGTDDWWMYNGSNISGPVISTGWHYFICQWEADGSGSFWVDGAEYTGTHDTDSFSSPLTLGARPNKDDEWHGHIGEIGYVDDALTSQEVSDLNDYLADKYGL